MSDKEGCYSVVMANGGMKGRVGGLVIVNDDEKKPDGVIEILNSGKKECDDGLKIVSDDEEYYDSVMEILSNG